MKKTTILAIALLLVSVGFLCGCNEEKSTTIKEPEIKYQDDIFLSWLQDMFSSVAFHSSHRFEALLDEDWDSHKYWAKGEKDVYEIIMEGSFNVEISEYYQEVREILILGCENSSKAMDYYIQGDRETGGYYENIGASYFEIVAERLGKEI